MTQRVRTRYRNHRRASRVALLGVAAAAALAALAIVLPALGAAGDSIPPASIPLGVTPTDVAVGGSNFSCTTNTGGQPPGMSSFSVSSLPNSTTPVTYNSSNSSLLTGVSLTLTGVNGQSKGKFFSFAMTGANVFHVGVKGGNDIAWYNYFGNSSTSGGVQSDSPPGQPLVGLADVNSARNGPGPASPSSAMAAGKAMPASSASESCASAAARRRSRSPRARSAADAPQRPARTHPRSPRPRQEPERPPATRRTLRRSTRDSREPAEREHCNRHALPARRRTGPAIAQGRSLVGRARGQQRAGRHRRRSRARARRSGPPRQRGTRAIVTGYEVEVSVVRVGGALSGLPDRRRCR